MASTKLDKEIQKDIKKHEDALSNKRSMTGNKDWQPVGGEHGPGVIPEEVWKQQNPNSKPETAPKEVING